MNDSGIKTFQKRRDAGVFSFSATGMLGIVFLFTGPQQGWAAMAAEPLSVEQSYPVVMEFNPSFIHGSTVDLSRYAEGNPVEPGTYPVTVLVNNKFRGKYNVRFTPRAGSRNGHACFTPDELKAIGIKPTAAVKSALAEIKDAAAEVKDTAVEKAPDATAACVGIEEYVSGGSVSYNSGDFELSVFVPQINLIHFPRGYIDPASWDAGDPVAFLDYSANLYTLYGRSKNDKTDYSSNFGLLVGFNAGEWRIRKRLHTSWSNRNGMHTQNLYGYAQTDITPLKSQLTLGDSNTRGEVFDSFTLRGAQLQSDIRMLPEGLRTYAPVLRGTAETNAKVTVRQRGQIVHETVVPPGPFELNDIGAMGYGGELEMTITEADGRERVQSIPFSAPPMILHEGVTQFGVALGEMKDDSLKSSPKVLQSIFQYGLSNLYTLYGGGQMSEHYRALAIGSAFNTPLGGISVDATQAWSDLDGDRKETGNSFRVGYSKYMSPTNTDVTLAAYRYSTKGYYSFREASRERYGYRNPSYDLDYRTRQRLTLTVGQRLWNDAYLFFNGSLYSYWDDRPEAQQYSVSYNKTERYFSYSLGASRTRDGEGKFNNSVTASVSVPINGDVNRKPAFSTVYSTYTHDNQGNDSFQANATGTQGENHELVYGIGTAVSKSSQNSRQESVSGNINYRAQYGQIGMSASADNRSGRQLSVQGNGSLVAHKGGMTLGPQLGEAAFAVVEVPGGEGARLVNGYGSAIDSHGFAIMPSLTPYRKNVISVSTKGLSRNVDILENESSVVPRAGSAMYVKVKTNVGAPVILIVKNLDRQYLPIGTELVDAGGVSQGYVGQGGQAFIRGWDPAASNLFVIEGGKKVCRVVPNKNIKEIPKAKGEELVQLEATCIQP